MNNDQPTAPEVLRQAIQALAKSHVGIDEEPTEDDISDATSELRDSFDGDAIGIKAWEWCRHYEVKPVYKKIGERYVCWLYWYGGGKHGDPGEVDWIDDARFISPGKPIEVPTFIQSA